MGVKTPKKQKRNAKMQGVVIRNGSMIGVACSNKKNTLEVCQERQIERIIEQCHGRTMVSRLIAQRQIMKETSRLVEQHMKRLEKERLEEEKRRKAKDVFMENYCKKQKKNRANRKEKVIETNRADLRWNSSALKESEELFMQISRKWGMNY